MTSMIIFFIGLAAQLLFAGRMIVQWVLSEKSKAVVSPKIFWRISLLGSILMCTYGWLQSDAAILVGQLITYFIYIRNLQHKGDWQTYPKWLQVLIISLPFFVLGYILTQNLNWQEKFLDDIPTWLIVMGLCGQILFTFRFVVQFYYSEKIKISVLPPQFWIISLLGSIIIFTYGILRMDYILIMGHGGGMIAYVRNIIIGRKEAKHA